MDLKSKSPFVSWTRLKKSFYYASKGIYHTWRSEQNFRIHIVVAFFVFIAAQILQVPIVEQAILAVVIGAVIGMELINTALEHMVDLVVQTYDERAKIIKDAAAGAVFVFALTAVLVGSMIFIPRVLEIFL
ncbi:diacylglycerol kinase [Salipaludibacillus keqinensis]|uniref:Diacylglycerol kinase n=1 Tax=Salipaludibacillus keqinensis TaxID=2045207 RepID=A0A323TJX4_9BACI|nr:diacylglycerol kinase family protein [Salipaludibacillus keqinensis]PYZ94254.1 diacylglycerol kinase [Salipaludibacillus keqinensis]